jgi:predicted metal-binding protein
VPGRLHWLGKELTCPPYVPTPDEFRKILAEYRYVLLVKFSSKAHADPDVICSLYKYWLDPDAPTDKKEQAQKFWNDYFAGSREILPVMLELEKIAFNASYTFYPCVCRGILPALRDLQCEGRNLYPPHPGTDPGTCRWHQYEENS